MPTEKPQAERVEKVKMTQRTFELSASASGFIGLAQEKRNRLVADAQAMVNNGEQVLRVAVETAFREAEMEFPKTPVQIVKNAETGMPGSLSWEEAAEEDEGEDEPESEVEAEKVAPVAQNGATSKRKLPVK
jgi:hypothetical protein